jgi:HAD superfamily hydrolase (TIGR01509 family)
MPSTGAQLPVYIDGRTREDGIRAFLAARSITLPEGNPDDGPDRMTVHGLAERKQQLFDEAIARSGIAVFPDAADLLAKLLDRGIPTALVTASRNGRAILDATGLSGMFTTIIDGSDVVRLGFRGKPDAAMFIEAVDHLGVKPADTVDLEDGVAGVKPGVAGDLGLLVGVDRAGHGAELAEAGAHLVLTSLDQLDAVLRDDGNDSRRDPPRGDGRNGRHGAALLRRCGNTGRRSSPSPVAAERDPIVGEPSARIAKARRWLRPSGFPT